MTERVHQIHRDGYTLYIDGRYHHLLARELDYHAALACMYVQERISDDMYRYAFKQEICAWISDCLAGPVSSPTWDEESSEDQYFAVTFDNPEDLLAFEMRWL